MWEQYNPNPLSRRVGDCAIRAVSKALDEDWETTYAMITTDGFAMADMPSSDAVWCATLRKHGFYRDAIPNSCPNCYTAEDFTKDHPKGTFVLAFGGHVATVKDGDLYDSWDSSQLVPQYYYYRKD